MSICAACPVTAHSLRVPQIRDGVTSRARVTLPSVLTLRSHLDSGVTVVTNVELRAGTLFGPMVAPHSERITDHRFPLKVRDGRHIARSVRLDVVQVSSKLITVTGRLGWDH